MPNTPLREKTIAVASSRWGGDGSVRISQYADYFELEISRCYADSPVFKSMSHDEARALRDALIELYPVEPVATPPYYVDFGDYAWRVTRTVRRPAAELVAKCADQETAVKVAAALNAQETTTNATP